MPALQRPVTLLRVLPQINKLWLPDSLWNGIVAEADRRHPLETGGVLLGYRAKEGREFVVTHTIGPGPKAVHKRGRFVPDHRYQLAEIARLYAEQSRLESHALAYLGDWHTHPGSGAYLSGRDRMTLRRIALTKSARAPQPVMLILGQSPSPGNSPVQSTPWQPKAWTGTMKGSRFAHWSLETRILEIHVFDDQSD